MLAKLIPESRKLQVLIFAVIFYVLNTSQGWISSEQMDSLIQLVMVWIGGQSIADAGLQGKFIARLRDSKRKNGVSTPANTPETVPEPEEEEASGPEDEELGNE